MNSSRISYSDQHSIPVFFADSKKLDEKLKTRSESNWVARGEEMAMCLFSQMATRVPAYQDFLKKNKFDYRSVKTIKDFAKIPPIDKDNYLRTYPLEELCWDGACRDASWTISTTSGSTGQPYYFPRLQDQAEKYAVYADLYFRHNFQVHKKSTLYVVGFPMGAWIGGIFTYETVRHLALTRGYNLSIITPGIHKAEIIKAVTNLGPHFDQVIIGSYGPFLKDTLDDGLREGVNWKKYNLKFIFSAEAFTEEFRDYVLRTAGIRGKDIFLATLNHYGTVDLGTMSYETPLSVFIRRQAVKRKKIYKPLLGERINLPTFTQYIPELFYFEEVNERLYCSSYSGLPLVRYDLKDRGGVTSFARVKKIFKDQKIDLLASAREAGLGKQTWRLPFVHVYERDDFSISFYAFQVYPETIRRALQRRLLSKEITGKFTMRTKFDSRQNQYIELNVEVKSGVRRTIILEKKIQEVVVAQLLKESSEYRETYGHIGKRGHPKIILWSYESPEFFKPGIKQKWVLKK